ncbi:MAG TPA: hypothetical protein VGP12_07910 [Nitrosospira sp.]|jgi:hypothetical protein|nr:hypothetical protein [Nitrosospira sp.]
MKISHTRITVERYRETVVRKEPDRCPQCGYEPPEPRAQAEPDSKAGRDMDIEISISKEEQY